MQRMQRIRVLLACALFSILLQGLIQTATAQSAPAWQPWTPYAIGNQVSYSGSTYSALQAHTSQPGWEPPSAPALWQLGSSGPACSAAPSAPTGLSASSVTSTGLTLGWSAAAVPSGCVVTSYTIYQNGMAVGTANNTSFAVSGLSPSTTYSFRVAATDAAGISPQSTAVSVTTSASGGNSGSGCAAAWNTSTVYTAGAVANVNGVNYIANYWTQGQNPASNSGPAGSGQPWTSQGACSTCTTLPSVPSGLTVTGTTSFSASLSWSPSTTASNCTVSGYTVFRSGTSVGTASGTSFTVSGLSPSTAYSFTVASRNEAGSSAQSSPVNVTTPACTGTCNPPGAKLFAPYIDMSLGASSQLLSFQQQSGVRGLTLAFLVSSSCSVGWGGLGGTLPQDSLPNGTTIQSLVQQLQASGVKIIIAFGGANGQDPAAFCSSPAALQAVYQSVINRYNVNMLDFDIEGGSVTNQVANDRRAQALVGLKAANPGLIVSYTLPVLPTGLVESGVNVLRSARNNGFNLDVVNVMAMDYGPAVDNGGQMGLNARLAASNTLNQVQSVGLASKIGVTPMIGVNDVASEIFTLADAQSLVDYARANSWIERLAMWSLSRDNGSCAGAGFASPVCSSISQAPYAFSLIFRTY